MELAAGLAAATQAISIAKSIKDADKALDHATLKAKLAEIISELADVKISQVAFIERIHELEAEIARLKLSDADFSNLVEESGYFYRREGNGLIGWPACPTCASNEKRLNFLVQNGGVEKAKCPSCKTEFDPVSSYLRPGYSRLDEHREKIAEKSRRTAAAMERLNSNSRWIV